MTCPDCRGTGAITLLYSRVPCDCQTTPPPANDERFPPRPLAMCRCYPGAAAPDDKHHPPPASDGKIPLLAEGREGIDGLQQRARDLGLTMSNETAAASEPASVGKIAFDLRGWPGIKSCTPTNTGGLLIDATIPLRKLIPRLQATFPGWAWHRRLNCRIEGWMMPRKNPPATPAQVKRWLQQVSTRSVSVSISRVITIETNFSRVYAMLQEQFPGWVWVVAGNQIEGRPVHA